MPKSDHDAVLNGQRRALKDARRELNKEREMNLNRLVESIRTVNMVKAKMTTPDFTEYASAGEIDEMVPYETIQPPDSQWYQIGIQIDMGKLRRIYEELSLASNSYEYRYLIDSINREIEHNIAVLMRVKQ